MIVIDYLNLGVLYKILQLPPNSVICCLFKPKSFLQEKILLLLLRFRNIEVRNEQLSCISDNANLFKEHIESSDKIVQEYVDSLDVNWMDMGAYFKLRFSQLVFHDIIRARFILQCVGKQSNFKGVKTIYLSQRWLGKLVEKNEFGLHVVSYRSFGQVSDNDYVEIYSPNRYLGMFPVQKYFLYMLYSIFCIVPISWPGRIKPSVLLFLHERSEERKYYGHSCLTENIKNCGVITNDLRLEFGGDKYRINRIAPSDIIKYILHIMNGCGLLASVGKINPIYKYKILIDWVRLFFLNAMLDKMKSKIIYSCFESSNALLFQYIAQNSNHSVSMASTYSGGEFPVKNEFSHQNKFADVYFIWGEYFAKLYRFSGDSSSRYVVCGYVGDAYKEEFKCRGEQIRKSLEAQKIIAIYDTTYAKDLFLDIDLIEKFMASILEVAAEFDAKIVIKTKKGAKIYDDLISQYPDRITLVSGRSDIAPSMCADVTIGYLLSSPVIVSGVWGRNIHLYDPDRILWDEWYKRGDDGLISFSDHELKMNVRNILKSYTATHPDLSDVDPFGDGKTQERIVAYISDVLDNFSGGKEHALDVANSNYKKKYGNDKVINNGPLMN